VALGGQVVNFIGLHLLDDADQVGGVGQIAIVQPESHLLLVRAGVKVVDARRVEGGRTTFDTVDFAALGQQELRQVGAALACDAGEQSSFHMPPQTFGYRWSKSRAIGAAIR